MSDTPALALPPLHAEIEYELPSGEFATGQVTDITDTHMLVTWWTGVTREPCAATGRFVLADVPELIRTGRLRPARRASAQGAA